MFGPLGTIISILSLIILIMLPSILYDFQRFSAQCYMDVLVLRKIPPPHPHPGKRGKEKKHLKNREIVRGRNRLRDFIQMIFIHITCSRIRIWGPGRLEPLFWIFCYHEFISVSQRYTTCFRVITRYLKFSVVLLAITYCFD